MALPRQTVALLQAARQLARLLPADAVLLMTETDLDWPVREHLGECQLLVAAEDRELTARFKLNPDLSHRRRPRQSHPGAPQPRLLQAVRSRAARPRRRRRRPLQRHRDQRDAPEPVDSLSVIHLGEHLERLVCPRPPPGRRPRSLWTPSAARQPGPGHRPRGPRGPPVGTMFVVGDTPRAECAGP